MIGGTPMCLGCKHFNFKASDRFCCDAFPDAIPITIVLNTLDHAFAAPGDNGVRYEPIPGGKVYGLAKRPQVQPQP